MTEKAGEQFGGMKRIPTKEERQELMPIDPSLVSSPEMSKLIHQG